MSSPTNSSTVTILPNPYTPMAWLTPEAAYQFEVSRYIYLVALGAFAWDWSTSLSVEFTILKILGLRLSTVIYCTSRVATMAYILTNTVFQTSSVPNCQALEIALGVCYIFADPFTSALFYLRIVAVHQHRPVVVIFLGVCMAAVLGCAVLVPMSISGTHIGNTGHCNNSNPKDYIVASPIASTVFDTLVFIAMSYKVSEVSSIGQETWRDRAKTFFSGAGLPTFSKMLLQGGQVYYGVTVALNIATTALLLTSSLPASVRVMLTIPNIALKNAMATRVFRQVQTGLTASHTTPEGFDLPSFTRRHEEIPPEEIRTQHRLFAVTPLRISIKDTSPLANENRLNASTHGDLSDGESEIMI